jgi:hypothetical protein
MHLTGTILFFWAAGLVGHVLIFLVLLLKRRVSAFPCFTSLIVANIANALILYAVASAGSKRLYLIAYFGFAVLDVLLQFAVSYELAKHIFCPTGVWIADLRKSFLFIVGASFPIAIALALFPVPPEKIALAAVLDRLNIFVAALQCELLVGMIMASAIAHLPWKTHVARIAQGLGLYSLVGLLADTGHSVVLRNSQMFQILTYTRMITYLGCQVYWVVTLWREAPAPKELPDEMRAQLFTLQRRLEYDLRKLRALK